MKPKVILASTSKYRKKLLDQLNISFKAIAPLVNEDKLKKQSSVSITDLPLFLAQKKAESLITDYPQHVIIGSDQMALFNKKPLHKAGTREKAIEQLLSMQGKEHTLITAVSVYANNKWHYHTDITQLRMRSLTREQIVHYVDLENPIDCAGSYKMESLGIALFDHIKTKDHSAIVGLPLMALTRILESVGVQVI